MLSNLLRPFILARLLSGAAVASLAIVALFVTWQVLRRFELNQTSEAQLQLERRAELSATVMQTALGISVFNLALTALTADHLSEAIRGAMCAYGVFSANAHGFLPLWTSLAAATACVLWLALHRLDLALPEPRLTRRKFVALLAVAPLLLIDLWATLAWAFDLDLGVVATCCSATIDRAGVQTFGADPSAGRATLYYAAVAILTLTIASLALLRRRPSRPLAWISALLSAASAGVSLPAIIGYVAPHVYENPRHLCPFCLLHADAWGIGWPLFGALFAGAASGLSLAVLESQRRASGDGAAVSALEARVARLSLWSFAIVLTLFIVPVVRYAIISGGASLFG